MPIGHDDINISSTKKRNTDNLAKRSSSFKFTFNNKLFNNSTNNNYATSNHRMMPSVTSRLKKNIARTKEKILQGIGRTDRTYDENFDLYVENFEQQHSQASKLTKELNKYLHCLRETQKSSKAFYDTLKDTFEPGWPDSHLFYEQVQLIEIKWIDYITRLNNDVQLPLIAYLNEFPELKKKIEKRGNRLLDYDNARHTLESLQNKTASHTLSNNTNKSSNYLTNKSHSTNASGNSATSNNHQHSSTDHLTKLTKLKIDLVDKQQIYEEINQTLCMALPVLYENRIKFYSSLFQTFFHTETTFYADCADIKSKLDDICECLSTKTCQQNSNPQRLLQLKLEQEKVNSNRELNNEDDDDGSDLSNGNVMRRSMMVSTTTTERTSNSLGEYCVNSVEINQRAMTMNIPSAKNQQSAEFIPPQQDIFKKQLKLSVSNQEDSTSSISSNNNNMQKSAHMNSSSIEDIVKSKITNSISNTNMNEINYANNISSNNINGNQYISHPNNSNNIGNTYLYKVRATYAYEAKEIDELTFVKDDLIQVVDGSESEKEDLDDGWLIGIHEASMKRGLFPENFTKRI